MAHFRKSKSRDVPKGLGRGPKDEAREPGTRDADFVVPGEVGAVRQPLDRVLRSHFGGSWESARKLVRTGKVRVDGIALVDPTMLVATGAHVAVRMASPRPVGALSVRKEDLVHVDAEVVVVKKPA